jgi:hypothetical protein
MSNPNSTGPVMSVPVMRWIGRRITWVEALVLEPSTSSTTTPLEKASNFFELI